MKTVQLKASNAQHANYPFLSDDITSYLIEKIQEIPGYRHDESIEVGYSLGYSQGDGVCIRKGRVTLNHDNPGVQSVIESMKKTHNFTDTKQVEFYLTFHKTSHHYEHENTFNCEVAFSFLDENENEFTEQDYEYDPSDIFIDTFRDICKDTEKYGYELIEGEDEQTILNHAFLEFVEENDIRTDYCLFDISEWTSTEPNESNISKYTHIATSGDTNIDGLWVQLPTLHAIEETKTYFTF